MTGLTQSPFSSNPTGIESFSEGLGRSRPYPGSRHNPKIILQPYHLCHMAFPICGTIKSLALLDSLDSRLGLVSLGCAAEASAASRSGAAQRHERTLPPPCPLTPKT